MPNLKNGALIAIAAGGLFAAACKKVDEKKPESASEMKAGDKTDKAGARPPEGRSNDKAGDQADEKTAKVHCLGVNSCKGQSACQTANSSCAGQNTCKGKGWIALAQADCKAQGGSIAKD